MLCEIRCRVMRVSRVESLFRARKAALWFKGLPVGSMHAFVYSMTVVIGEDDDGDEGGLLS